MQCIRQKRKINVTTPTPSSHAPADPSGVGRDRLPVRHFRAHTGLPLYEVVNMAFLYPARSVRVNAWKGSVEPGKDADILIADRDFNTKQTLIREERVL